MGEVAYGRESSVWARLRIIRQEHGVRHLVLRLFLHPRLPWNRFIWNPTVALLRRASSRSTVVYGGQSIPYMFWCEAGERIVEVPIALRFLASASPSEPALEVGNVLRHFVSRERFPSRYVVLDKYERSPGVVNSDVTTFVPEHTFSTILSISTLEHVGFDEDEQDPSKFRRAVEHLYHDCLANGGRMLVTVPVGYNPAVDALLREGHLGVGRVTTLVRSPILGSWQVCADGADRPYLPYDLIHHHAREVAVWEIVKP